MGETSTKRKNMGKTYNLSQHFINYLGQNGR